MLAADERLTSERIASVEEAVGAIARGEMVVVVDSEDRENERDLVMAAERVTPEAVNFMATPGRGLICVPMLAARLESLGIRRWSRAMKTPTVQPST